MPIDNAGSNICGLVFWPFEYKYQLKDFKIINTQIEISPIENLKHKR